MSRQIEVELAEHETPSAVLHRIAAQGALFAAGRAFLIEGSFTRSEVERLTSVRVLACNPWRSFLRFLGVRASCGDEGVLRISSAHDLEPAFAHVDERTFVELASFAEERVPLGSIRPEPGGYQKDLLRRWRAVDPSHLYVTISTDSCQLCLSCGPDSPVSLEALLTGSDGRVVGND